MKKSILIIVLGVGFAFISCEKQDIQPRSNCNQDDAPRWEQSSSVTAPGTSGSVTNTTGADNPDGGGITDPNDDEDGNGRKKV